MASKTESVMVEIRTCDLCGQQREDLATVYGKRGNGKSVPCDVCLVCQARPVADVLAYLASAII